MIKNVRLFEITFISPTNYRGLRVKIKDHRHEKTKIIPYDHKFNNTYEIAINYLKGIGIKIATLSNTKDAYFLTTNNFKTQIREV